VNAQVSVCLIVGQQQEREKEWGIYTSPKKLAVTVLPQHSSVLLTQGRYYRGVSEN
jgi:hypothetical protein